MKRFVNVSCPRCKTKLRFKNVRKLTERTWYYVCPRCGLKAKYMTQRDGSCHFAVDTRDGRACCLRHLRSVSEEDCERCRDEVVD